DLKKGAIVQIQRKGFYICDRPYAASSPHSGVESPLVLISVPDGHVKEMPTAVKKQTASDGQRQSASPAKDQKATANGDALKAEVDAQGELVRTLKAGGGSADDVKAAVAKLLALKAKYKEVTGVDYQAQAPAQGGAGGKKGKEAEKKPAEQSKQQNASSAANGDAVKAEVDAQGELVRTLKAGKASADDVKAAVAKLLTLKAKYKEVTGVDYQAQVPAQGGGGKKGKEAEKKPAEQPKQQNAPSASNGDALKAEVDAQGELVRTLKAGKASADDVKAAVAKLLALKAKYKEVTGLDYQAQAPAQGSAGGKKGKEAEKKPAEQSKQQQQSTMAPPATDNESSNGDALKTEIDAQGELVRKLKGSGGSEAETKAAIAKLLELKAKYKEVTGVDLAAAGGGGNKKGKGGGDKKAADKPKQAEKAAPQAAGGDA
uniref:WHEP-TRS domain-containing protein n=1 Tax=Plectus sambesii TaxID=2011161 RepID=A0A914UZJ9_9BILA